MEKGIELEELSIRLRSKSTSSTSAISHLTRKTTVPFINRTFKLLNSMLLLPYKWNKEEGIFVQCKKLQKIYWNVTVCGFAWFNFSFVSVQLIRATYKMATTILDKNEETGSPQYGELNIQIFLFILSTLYAVFQLNLYSKTDQVADFYMHIESYRQILKGQDTRLRNDFLVVYLVTMMIVMCNLMQGVAALIFPHRPQFLYSIVPKSLQHPILHRMFFIYNCHLTCSSVATSLILVFGVFLYIETMNTGMEASIRQEETLGTQEELVNYRIWQLISNRFNDCFGRLTVPAIIWCLGTTGVTCGFGSIRFVGKISIIEYMILPPPVLCVLVFLVYLIVPAAKIEERSQTKKRFLIASQKTLMGTELYKRTMIREMRCCIRSYHDIQIYVRNWFRITKLTFISLLSFIIYQTISMLLYF